MKISVTYGEALQQATPLLALGTWEDELLPREIGSLLEAGDWTGKWKQALVVYPRGALSARRVLLVGLGEAGPSSTSIGCVRPPPSPRSTPVT